MKDTIRLFFATLLSATFAVAQPTPPTNSSVTANTSTGALVSPTAFFTGNQAAIASAVGNAGITGNVTIGASNTLTLSGTATGTPTGGTLNFSNLTFTLPAGAFQSGSLVATAIADPATPPTNTGYVFYDLTHKNYNIKNDAGTTLNMVIPKTAVTNEFVTAVSRNGTITTAQPSISNISGLGSGWSTTLTAATGTNGQVLASNGTSYVATTLSGTSIFGTANQITASSSTGNVTLSVPSAFIFPGNATLNGTSTLTLGGGGAGGATISASGNTTTSNLVLTPPSLGNVSVASGNLSLSNSGSVSWPGLGNSISAGSGGTTQFVGSPTPTSDSLSYSLGALTLRWNNLFLGGTAYVNRTALGTTSTTGLQLANTTATTGASTGAQYSPRILFTGHAWNTTPTAADNYLEAIQELRPTSNVATPTSTLAWGFRRSTDGATGSFTDAMTLTSAGQLTTISNTISKYYETSEGMTIWSGNFGAGGQSNTGVGFGTLYGISGGFNNTAIGYQAGRFLVAGGTNTAVGSGSLYTQSSNGGSVAIGYYAGRYATAGNEFYVNNQDRTDLAGDKAKSLLYGVFASTAAGQSLTINGTLIASVSTTPASATAAGVAGTIAWDSSYIYICTATNTWKRVAIATW